jgi:hypothetical protein
MFVDNYHGGIVQHIRVQASTSTGSTGGGWFSLTHLSGSISSGGDGTISSTTPGDTGSVQVHTRIQ